MGRVMKQKFEVPSTPEVLPKQIRLTAPPTMPQARSYLFKQQSTLPSYTENGMVQINLPRLQRSYLTNDSYLKFQVNCTWTPETNGYGNTYPERLVCLEPHGAFAFFDKIEVYDYLGSTLLESTNAHSALSALLLDLDVSDSERKTHFNVLAGTSGGTVRPQYGLPESLPEIGYLLDATAITGWGSLTLAQTQALIATNLSVVGAAEYNMAASGANSLGQQWNGGNIAFANVFVCADSSSAITTYPVGVGADNMIFFLIRSDTQLSTSYVEAAVQFNTNQATDTAAFGITNDYLAVNRVSLVAAAGLPAGTGTVPYFVYLVSLSSPGINDGKTAPQFVKNTGGGSRLLLKNVEGLEQVFNLTYGQSTGGSIFMPPFHGSTTASGGTVDLKSPVTVSKEFAIPLFSFLGLLSDKYAPLHNGYTLQLTLAQTGNTFGVFTPGSYNTLAAQNAGLQWTMTNVYFEAQILELGPVAEQLLFQSTNGMPFVIPTKAFRNYTSTIPAGASQVRLDLNINVASLTNIMWIMRLGGQYLNNSAYRSHQRIRNFAANWYFQYGSSILPQTTGITCSDPGNSLNGSNLSSSTIGSMGTTSFTEAYCELIKSRHSLNSDNFNTTITRENFGIDIPGLFSDNTMLNTYSNSTQSFVNNSYYNSATYNATTNALFLDPSSIYEYGRFAAGLDLELVPGKSGDLVTGLNTNGMNTSIFINFLSQINGFQVSPVAARLDAWAEFDSFINISPGLATTVSF